jgi:formate-dependent nitrite reductase cytochrome c552 subunit
MSNRRKPTNAQRVHVTRSRSLSRLIRQACSSCESPRLRWLDAEEARAQFRPEWLNDVLRDVGPLGEFWLCLDCGDHGAFGLATMDWSDALDARMTGVTGSRPPV